MNIFTFKVEREREIKQKYKVKRVKIYGTPATHK